MTPLPTNDEATPTPPPATSGWSFLRKITLPPWPIALLACVFIFGAAFTLWGPVRPMAWRIDQFPATNSERPQWQQNITNVTREQFLNNPPGSYYFGPACNSQILPEALPEQSGARVDGGDVSLSDSAFPFDCDGKWDAAFVTWVMNTVGMPVAMPSAKDPYAWLEPDVDRLMEKFRAADAFHDEPDFMPQIGDVVFYDEPGTGKHVNFVVEVPGDVVTVGGDEVGGVGLSTMRLAHRGGIIGFGATGQFERPIRGDGELGVAPEVTIVEGEPTETFAPEDPAERP